MKPCGSAVLNSNETLSLRKAERILASCSRENFETSKEDHGCFCCLGGELLSGCDRSDSCRGHDPAVLSLALAASSSDSSAPRERFSTVTHAQCYNITFFLRLPLPQAKEQGASQGSYDPTVPRRSHEKPGLLFLSAGSGRLLRTNQVTFKPWPVRSPAPVNWQFEEIGGRNRRKQC